MPELWLWNMPELKFVPLNLNLYFGLFNFNSFPGLSTNLDFFNFNGFLGFCFKIGFSFVAQFCNLKLFYSIWVKELFARAVYLSRLGGLEASEYRPRPLSLFVLSVSIFFLFQVVNGTFQKTQVATRQIHFLEKPCFQSDAVIVLLTSF